jgi:sugar phosphate isomerase/epimerase
MTQITRRQALAAGLAVAASALLSRRCAASAIDRKMTLNLVCGAIGVQATQIEAIALAHAAGFESVEARPDYLAGLSDGELSTLKADLAAKKLVWGAAGLPVEFREDEARFNADLKELPRLAAGLKRAGVTRVGTWIRPSHPSLSYIQNFRQHARRLRAIAQVLHDAGIRFGLEYVSPKTSWTASRHSFVHSMTETKDLIAEIHVPGVGFVLDSWHWYNAQETVDDLMTLTNEQIVAVDLNDAPAGIPIDQQMDLSRELPAATGVIDVGAFLGALIRLGYDGPVRAEPFNAALNRLPKEEAVSATIRAMKKAFALAKV